MKHKTWFRLVVKAIGIYLLASALPNLVNQIYFVVSTYLSNGQMFGTPASPWPLTNYWLPLLLFQGCQFGVGLYLLFGGKWIVNLCIPSNRPYCPECGYDISEATGKCCPECGVQIVSRETPETKQDAGAPQ